MNDIFLGNKKVERDVKIMAVVIFITIYSGILIKGRFWENGLSEPYTPQVAEAQEVVKAEVVPTSTPSPAPTVKPLTLKEQFKEEVKLVFGDFYPQAMLLLQGNGPDSCAENRNLDPNADNDNTWWGGVGIDRGYWQINSVFHPGVSEWCARDIKCSTNYAWRMFKNDNYSFRRWTCGKVYGI